MGKHARFWDFRTQLITAAAAKALHAGRRNISLFRRIRRLTAAAAAVVAAAADTMYDVNESCRRRTLFYYFKKN